MKNQKFIIISSRKLFQRFKESLGNRIPYKLTKVTGSNSILINRTDRLGDAIVILPLLLALKDRFQLTVLSSQYNDWVMKDLVKTIPIKKVLKYNKSIRDFFQLSFLYLSLLKFFLRKSNNHQEYDIFLDLVGDLGSIKRAKD